MTIKVRQKYLLLKWFAVSLVFCALLLGGLTFYLSIKLKPIITTELKDLVLKATGGLYRIEFSEVNINVLTGISAIKDVEIIPDTNVFNQMILSKRAPNNLYHVKLKKLSVRNFHPLRVYQKKKLDIDLLLFENPAIVMTNKQFDFNEDKSPIPKRSPYDYIARYLKELRVKTIDFRNIHFKYVNNNLAKPTTDTIANLNIILKDWLIDPHSAVDSSRIYLVKEVMINLHNYRFASPDSLYHVNFKQLDFSSATGKLNIKNLSVLPRLDEQNFAKAAGYAKDRYHVEMNEIGLSGVNLQLYVLKQDLSAQEMNVSDGHISVFNNNAFPRSSGNKIGRYPHQLLQRAASELYIGKLNISNVLFSYAQFDRDSQRKGVITFERTSGTVLNLTNVPKAKARNQFITADLSTYMMGSGKLDVQFRFNLAAQDGAFSYSGTLNNMDGRDMNRITKPLGLLQVQSGIAKKLEFNIKANDREANGQLKFAYNNLSVALLRKVKGEDRLVKQGLMSILANAMVLSPDNPRKDGVFVTAPIHFKRPDSASFFSFIWKTLFQGIKHSIGITPAKEAEIKQRVARFEKMKRDREQRRTAREKRRAAQQ